MPAEAGMHRFIWHMRYPDARVVPGDKLLEDKVGGPLAPPQQTHDVFRDLSGRINMQLQRLDEVTDQDVTGFEHLLRELQIPAIVPRTGP